jgi:OFA family oxalate/formate antiporter-like MFS transporter
MSDAGSQAPTPNVMNRWLVVVGALLVQLALGAIYAWSVFTVPLKAPPYSFTAAQTQVIFSAGLASFAIVMVLAGRLMAKVGPRKVALAGGVTLGVGYMLGGFLGSSFVAQLVCIGFIGGAGIGLAYVTPIAVGMRWFPDKKGFITGLAVAGFGFGALGWMKVAGEWGGLLKDFRLFELPPVQSVFFLYGIIFLVMVVLGALVMVYPPDGWKPAGWVPPEAKKGGAAPAEDFESGEMLRTPQYYMILTTFAFSAMAGLMTIGIIKLFGIDALQSSGLTAEEAGAISGTAMAVFYALANGIGRIVWGTISDVLGWKKSVVLMTALQGLTMLAFFWMGKSEVLLYVGAAIVGFNFGGNFALFPVATAGTFGTRNVGKNYGWVFLAYGVGGIVGPIMAGYFGDMGAAKGVDAWLPAFLISGALCLVASGISAAVRRPSRAATTQAKTVTA